MYVTALSNYNLDIYPENNTSCFTNKLAEPIHLRSGAAYEIALAAFSYSADHVIQSDDLSFKVFDWKYQQKDNPNLWGTTIDLKLKHATINNAADLCTALNSLIWTSIERFKQSKREFFTYGNNKRVWVNFNTETYITVTLNEHLLVVLGCAKKEKRQSCLIVGKSKPSLSYEYKGQTRYFKDKTELKSHAEKRDYFVYPPNLGLTDEIILYCDVSRSVHVASSMSNILKFLVISRSQTGGAEQERKELCFGSTREYQPLICNNINEIRFVLTSVDGTPIRLKEYVRVLIHIREKNENQLLASA